MHVFLLLLLNSTSSVKRSLRRGPYSFLSGIMTDLDTTVFLEKWRYLLTPGTLKMRQLSGLCFSPRWGFPVGWGSVSKPNEANECFCRGALWIRLGIRLCANKGPLQVQRNVTNLPSQHMCWGWFEISWLGSVASTGGGATLQLWCCSPLYKVRMVV